MNRRPAAIPHLTVGLPREWEHFRKRHGVFLDRFYHLRTAFNIAFNRVARTSDPLDRVIYFSGRLCVEEFSEILLLCANGYGVAAIRLVRGMFERTVTARYLSEHPEETDSFFEFYWVNQRKLMRPIEEAFGADLLKGRKVEVEENFRRVKHLFTVTDCKTCGTTRVNHTWSKLDLVSMAKKAGPIGELIVPAYYIPTQEAHSTIGAILSRLDKKAKGMIFDGGPQRKRADDALISAHNLILNQLDLQKEYFKLTAMEKPLQTCFADFQDIWDKKEKRVRRKKK